MSELGSAKCLKKYYKVLELEPAGKPHNILRIYSSSDLTKPQHILPVDVL